MLDKLTKQFLHRELAEQIRRSITEKDLWGQFLAPERQLADALGVSRDTVRKGMKELEREGLVVRLHGRGNRVKDRSAPLPSQAAAGRVLVGISGGGSPDFVSGIAEVAGEHQWLAAFTSLVIPSARAEFMSRLSSGAADAVVLISVVDRRAVEEVLAAYRGPVVMLDHHFPGLPVTGVMENGAGGVEQAVAHLVGLGHRRIGLVEHTRRELNPWKHEGYVRAHRATGLPLDERLIVPAAPLFESGQHAGEQLLALAEPPTGVVAASDHVAWGVWRAMEAAGRRVGHDVALVGYGDTASQTGMGHELSSVQFDPVEMGRVAMRRAVAAAGGEKRAEDLVLTPTELVVRFSSKDVRPGPAQNRVA